MKVRRFLCALILFFAAAPAAHARPDVVDQYVEAVLARDAATLERILAANYLHINGNGFLQDKEHFINSLKSGEMRVDRLSISDVVASHYGGAMLITGNIHVHGKFSVRQPQGLQRAAMVAESKNGEEKIILFQATPVWNRKEARVADCSLCAAPKRKPASKKAD